MRPLSFRFSSLVVLGALAVVACGNISLSSSSPAASGFGPTGLNDIDAAADAGAPSGLLGSGADAGGSAPTAAGNPLCNYGYVDTASHKCEPDDSVQCTESASDAGIVEGSTIPIDGATPNGGGEYDGGAGDAHDAGAAEIDAGPATPACHVIEQGAIDGGSWRAQLCTAAGTGGEGDQCQVSTDCEANYECVGMPGQCRRYCCEGNSSCSATSAQSFCDVQPVASGKFDVPVCMPVSACSLFGKCPPNETCAVVEDDGTTSCVDIGTAKAGDPCDAIHCAAGLTCLGDEGSRTCFQLCHVDSTSECPDNTTCTGSAQLFKDPQFGICQ